MAVNGDDDRPVDETAVFDGGSAIRIGAVGVDHVRYAGGRTQQRFEVGAPYTAEQDAAG